MKQYRQEPPFCIQIELVEGCNLRCTFCGLNGIRAKENNLKFMKLSTATLLANRIQKESWNARIEFAMHGEPTLHPSVDSIVRIFRRRLPKSHLMMTSNGGGLLRDPSLIDKLLDQLNVLALDDYDNVTIVDKLLSKYKGDRKPGYYPDDKKNNPHRRRKINEHDWVIVRDIVSETKGNHSVLNSHCGGGSDVVENPKIHDKCAKPFRELSIRWDGNVALCCNDFRGIYKIGNIQDYKSLDELWQSEGFMAARKVLYNNSREFMPCEWCTAASYRIGLLPDKYGKEEMEKPTKKDFRIIYTCVEGEPYTTPVLRKWEQDGKVYLPEGIDISTLKTTDK